MGGAIDSGANARGGARAWSDYAIHRATQADQTILSDAPVSSSPMGAQQVPDMFDASPIEGGARHG
jgi:hypothetical protein